MTSDSNYKWYALPIVLIFCFVMYSAWNAGIWYGNVSREEIDAIVTGASEQYGVPRELIHAIIWKESRYNAFAVGRAGEIGLMQIHAPAVKEWATRTGSQKPPRHELFRPEVNINIGTWYLAWTASHWSGYKSSLLLQISEYNAGYGNVTNATKGWKPKNPATEIKLEEITIDSTRQYVKDVIEKMNENRSINIKSTQSIN